MCVYVYTTCSTCVCVCARAFAMSVGVIYTKLMHTLKSTQNVSRQTDRHITGEEVVMLPSFFRLCYIIHIEFHSTCGISSVRFRDVVGQSQLSF
jgi:hypothetical protein